MTEEQLIAIGNDASILLNSEAFSTTINGLVDATFQGFVNTKPGDAEERERAYNHYRAIVDITNTLRQQVAVRDEIDAKNSSDDVTDNSDQEVWTP